MKPFHRVLWGLVLLAAVVIAGVSVMWGVGAFPTEGPGAAIGSPVAVQLGAESSVLVPEGVAAQELAASATMLHPVLLFGAVLSGLLFTGWGALLQDGGA